MFGDAEGEFQIRQLSAPLVRAWSRTVSRSDRRRPRLFAALCARKPASPTVRKRQARERADRAGPPSKRQPQILSSPPRARWLRRRRPGAMMTSVEDLDDSSRASRRPSLRFSATNAAKGRNRIAAQRLDIGLLQRGAFPRRRRGWALLYDRDRRPRARGNRNSGDAFEGGRRFIVDFNGW